MIEVNSLNYKKDKKIILDNVSFSIENGEFVSLVGENGSGKSTIALALSGLLEDIKGVKTDKKIGLILENPDNQIIGSTVREDIAFGLQNMKMTVNEIDYKIDEVLKVLNIEHLNQRDTWSLSGGEKQKLALASLIVLDYEVYIFDEATSMLDPESKKIVINLLKQLHNEGKTIIQITHFMDEVKLTKRTIVIKEAKIVFDGDTKNLFEDKKFLEENGLI